VTVDVAGRVRIAYDQDQTNQGQLQARLSEIG
jgi:hypothetical protein